MKQITIQVSPEGEITIEAVGYRGASCEQATRALEKALGVPGKRTRKPDFFQGNNQQQKAGL
jgi:hypothetical protein